MFPDPYSKVERKNTVQLDKGLKFMRKIYILQYIY